MLVLGPTGSDPRPERVIAVLQPQQADPRRKGVAGYLIDIAEGIPGTLHDQGRGLQRAKVGHPKDSRFAHRMERVAEADQPAGPDVIRDHAGHPPSQGLAADHQAPAAAEPFHDLAPRVEERLHRIRRALSSRPSPFVHVGKLEANRSQTFRGHPSGDSVHERGVHRRAGAVGQHQGSVVVPSLDQEIFDHDSRENTPWADLPGRE